MSNEKEIAQKIYADICEEVEEIRTIKEWNIETIPQLVQIIFHVVIKVEGWMERFKGITSEQKKKVAVEVINKFIDIPIAPEWFEAKLIGMIIDKIIDFLNRTFGHRWLMLANYTKK